MNDIIPIKEDGSLDIERIDALSHDEYPKVVNKFTSKQREYYYSHLQINETQQHVKAVKFHPLEYVLDNGLGVDIKVYITEKKRQLKKKEE